MFAALNRGLARLEEALIALLLAGMVLMTFSQVILRYGFNAGWVWSLEATTYMFGALLMVGISFAMRQYAHMNVDAFINTLPRAWKRAATYVAITLCFFYVILMVWGSVGLVIRLQSLASDARDLPIKRWVLMCMLPAGFSLLALRLVQATISVIRGERDSLGSAHGHPRDAGAQIEPKVAGAQIAAGATP
jgi:C4-dicarboxylate transporter DctQ subunit